MKITVVIHCLLILNMINSFRSTLVLRRKSVLRVRNISRVIRALQLMTRIR